MSLCLKNHLEQAPIRASAPCRIDSGGTWDIKTLALPFERIKPTTINIALNLRTEVTLSPYKENRIKISSDGFTHVEDYSRLAPSMASPFGLFIAAISFFDVQGLHVHIRSGSPVKSALGGSSTALIALIRAICKAKAQLGHRPWNRDRMLHLGYHLEDSVSNGKCGVQDQAAAVYGGINQWIWAFGNKTSFYKRVRLLDKTGGRDLSHCILIAFSGKQHASARINQSWIKDFLSGKTRAGWIEVNALVHQLAGALAKKNWSRAAGYLRDEMTIRRSITPDALIPVTERLIAQAERLDCGARFTGAGAGGAIWALGPPQKIDVLRIKWTEIIASLKGARLLDCSVDPAGVL